MKPVFVDTSCWIALLHRGDNLHGKAIEEYQASRRSKRVTTDAVIIEVCNAFSKVTMRHLAQEFMNNVAMAKQLGFLRVIHVSDEIFQSGWQLYADRKDKDWGLTDCLSFVVMKEEGIKRALSSDHHFEQAGFEILL